MDQWPQTYLLMLPLMQRARSFVMKPASMVSMHTASRFSANHGSQILVIWFGGRGGHTWSTKWQHSYWLHNYSTKAGVVFLHTWAPSLKTLNHIPFLVVWNAHTTLPKISQIMRTLTYYLAWLCARVHESRQRWKLYRERERERENHNNKMKM